MNSKVGAIPGARCCGKPRGCTKSGEGCVYLRHPWKRAMLFGEPVCTRCGDEVEQPGDFCEKCLAPWTCPTCEQSVVGLYTWCIWCGEHQPRPAVNSPFIRRPGRRKICAPT